MARKKTSTRKKKARTTKTRRGAAARTVAPRRKANSRRKKTTTRRTKTRAASSRAPRKTARATAAKRKATTRKVQSLSKLHDQLMSGVAELEARRSELLAELAEVERAIAAFDPSRLDATVARARRAGSGAAAARSAGTAGSTRSGGRTKGAGGKNLAESLHALLRGREMRVKDMTDAVQKAGYKTASPNFRVIVNQTLLANPDLFRKVSRGVYTAT